MWLNTRMPGSLRSVTAHAQDIAERVYGGISVHAARIQIEETRNRLQRGGAGNAARWLDLNDARISSRMASHRDLREG
jgi:hypothetical protein